MNRIILIGRLTADPDLRYTPNGNAVCKFTLAVDRERGGEDKETDFIQCQSWGKSAERLAKYMRKGGRVAVDGSIRIDRVKGENGKADKWFTTVNVARTEFLGNAGEGQRKQSANTDEYARTENGTILGKEVSFSDEDLPF